MRIDIVIGEDDFSEGIAKKIDAKFIRIKTHIFPDSEVKPILETENGIKDNNVLLVLRTNRFNPAINDSLMKIFFIISLLKEIGAKEINLLLPYMFYSRQDKQFLPGEVKSFSNIAELYESLGISNIITVNSHLYGKKPALQSFFKKIKVHDLSPVIIFAYYLRTKNLKNPIVIGPGKGADRLIQELAELLGSDFEGLEKERNHKTLEVTMKPPKTNLKDRDVIIYDDVTGGGGTPVEAFNTVYKENPRRIFITLVHIISKQGIEKLSSLKTSEIITTDSFISEEPKKFIELSLIHLISNYIEKSFF
jgi:ribose-phosphate pyrophosphokinase